MREIAGLIQSLRRYFEDRPDKAISADSSASAVLEGGLRFRVEGPNGARVATDMPKPSNQ